MERKRLLRLATSIVMIVSIVISQYMGKLIVENLYARYDPPDDARAMMIGFTVACIYIPLIAGGIGVITFLTVWLIMKKQIHISLKAAIVMATAMFAATAASSLLVNVLQVFLFARIVWMW